MYNYSLNNSTTWLFYSYNYTPLIHPGQNVVAVIVGITCAIVGLVIVVGGMLIALAGKDYLNLQL